MTKIELFEEILAYASGKNYPDVHIASNHKPAIRNKSGDIIFVEKIEEYEVPLLNLDDIKDMILNMAGEDILKEFEEKKEMDISYKSKNNDRYRVNFYVDTKGYSIALRIIPKEIPTMEKLGLGEQIKEMCSKSKGLILVTGPTGAGKSTNLAAMIDYINSNYKKHIITIEDPVEFSFDSKKSLVNQREVGHHTKSFSESIRAFMREDPDIIMLGEMRDLETIKAALTLAETGHLVLSTLHTIDSVQTIDRIVDVFPASQQKQIKMQLSMSLVGIISQRLIPNIDDEGRVPAREILISNSAVRNLITTGKTHQLYSVLEIGQKQGMILMDKYLIALYKKGIISKDSLMSYVRDKDGVELML